MFAGKEEKKKSVLKTVQTQTSFRSIQEAFNIGN